MAPPTGLRRLLGGMGNDGNWLSLSEHIERFGDSPASAMGAEELARLLDDSGLRGRGGAGFPAAVKVRAVGSRRGRLVVVANGAEGEPASSKDRLLLTAAPHLVLDGVGLVAEALDVGEAIVCVKRVDAAAHEAVAQALVERAEAGTERCEIELVAVASGYVAGEESALVNELNGGPPGRPTFVPPRPFQSGVGGRPTLIQNVETFAHIGLIGRFGSEWYREQGTPEDPGTHLVTLSGAVQSPGVYEMEGGGSLEDLIGAAGGVAGEVQAYLIGGYGGTWFDAALAPRLGLGHADMRAVGGALGPGIVVVLPAGACGIAETARVLRFMAEESSGQCGPCVHGLAAVAYELEELAAGVAGPGAVDRLERWCADIDRRGACSHPDGAVRMVRSCLTAFSADLAQHESGHACRVPHGAREVLPLPGDLAWAG